METVESPFSGIYEILNENFVPIAVVLVLVLLVIGWLVYKSFSSESKTEDFEPDTDKSEEEDTSQEAPEEEESSDEDKNISSE
jgi:hypothetical protein